MYHRYIDDTREQAIRKREELAAKLSSPSGVLRGSLLQRTIHHSTGCLKCARGEGHPLWVLTVGYPGGKTRQVSVRPEQVPLVRKAIEEYRDVKAGTGGNQRTESIPCSGWIARKPKNRNASRESPLAACSEISPMASSRQRRWKDLWRTLDAARR